MAARDKEEKRKDEVADAIRSLYGLFPETGGYSMRGKRTDKVLELRKRVAAREEELGKDSKLATLKRQLKEEQARINSYGKQRRLEVDALLREFRLRGESESLLKRIEKLSRAEAIVLHEDSDD